jgi:DNA-binding ferritin-like protein
MFKSRKHRFSDQLQDQVQEQLHHVAEVAERLSDEHLRQPLEKLSEEQLSQARDKADQLLVLLKETQKQWRGIGDKEMKKINKYSDELVKLLEDKKHRIEAAAYAFEHPNPRPRPAMLALMLIVGLISGYWLHTWLSSSDSDQNAR